MTEQIHSTIIQAICQVQSGLGAVKKSQKNVHGGYMFASTDDIYAELCRSMAAAGLVIIPLEEEAEIQRVEKEGKVSQWARCVFSFVLATSEATWTDKRSKRTLFIQVTGPQTFQAAQSYAEKAYLRALFKIPTGDMDLDSLAQADTEEDQAALNSRAKRKSSASSKRDGTDDVFNGIRAELAAAYGDRSKLKSIRSGHAVAWSQMPARWVEILDQEYEDALLSCRDAAE